LGPNPARPGLITIGTVLEPVPVTGSAANFPLAPRIAALAEPVSAETDLPLSMSIAPRIFR